MKKFHMAYCLIPVAAAAVLILGFGVKLPALGLLLLCPLMMIVMMGMMMGQGHDHGADASERDDVRSPEPKPPSVKT